MLRLRLVLWIITLLFIGGNLSAQAPNLELTLRYNPALTRYEVYARPSATQPNFNWGPSQISIVAPASIPDAAFNVTSVSGGAWLDNSLIYNPAALPGFDFHGVGSLGAPTSFTANVEKLIFHFTLPGGGCTPGLRLFINGVDPNSSQPGMGGGDFTNTIFAIVPGVPFGYEAYTNNYNNNGTSCNAPPVANDDTASTPEDTPITINPLANDTDINNNIDPTTVTIVTPPVNGTVTVNPVTGELTITPDPNFTGVITFTYSVCDTGTPVYCDDAVVTITVVPVNDPPVANNDVATTPEDTPVTFPVTTNDTDVDGMIDPATLDLDPATPGVQTTFTVPGQGTFTANQVTGQVTFTPVSNFNGTSSIPYVVCDNGTPLPAQCDDATITVTVTPVNDAPVANNDVATTPEDTPVTFPVTANDTDVDGMIDPATLDLDPATPGVQTTFTVPGQGTFTANPVTGQVTFTPVSNFNGTSSIPYVVCDNGTPLPAQCDDATITVTVTPVNDPPVANNDNVTTPEDTPVTFPVTTNDTDVDGMIDPATLDLDPATPGVQTTFTVPGQGTFTANPVTGQVTFTPVSNFNGTSSIPYVVCDNGTPLPTQCDDATITVTVTPVNDPPIANNDVATTPEDTPIMIPVLSNDTDVDGTLNPATVDLDPATPGVQTTFTVPGQGTFTVDPVTGIVTFTPVPNFNGTSTITYVVCDTGTPLPALCDDATITVMVNPVNDPPVANNDVATTPEDTPVTITVLANDTDLDGTLNPTTIDLDPATPGVQTSFTVPGQGTFTVDPVTGVVTFTPLANFNGPVTPITYVVCDNGTPLPAQCDDATITVTVTPVNDPPVANNDVATTPEDTPIMIPVLTNDTDVEGPLNPATVDLDPATPGVQTSFTVPGQGTFTVDPVTGVVTFTPVPNFNGTSTITYVVCDNGTPLPALCDDATITVTINPVNDPPVANNDVATTPEDTPVTITVLANDTDLDGTLNPTTIDLDPATPGVQTSFTVPGQGTFTVNPVTGVVTFTPVANFNGPVTPITYVVCDNGTPLPAQCDDATITVTVTPVNDPPVANNDVASTPEDTPVTIPVLTNDTDVDGTLNPSTVDLDPATPGVQISFTVPGQGTFTVDPVTGVVTFTPVPNFNGTSTITYVVCDNGTPLPALCDDATITVTIGPVNDPPVANNDVATTPEDTPVTIPVLANDTDSDGALNPATIDLDPATPGVQTSFTVPGQGTFTVNPVTGVVTFTPVANFNGPVTPITYSVCDNGTPLPAQCDDATITVTVTPVNDAPIANNDVATTPEDTPVTFPVTANDTDVDGMIDPATLDLDPTTPGVQTTFTVPGQGTFTANPVTGQVTFTPVLNFTGTSSIPYVVCDNGTPLPALCDDATITVTVTPTNDPPTISQPPVTTPEDTPVVFCPTIGDPDPGNTLTLSICNTPANGTAVVGPGNCITFTPAPNFTGVTLVCVQVCDQGGLCATVDVPVTVTPVNDPPIANNDVATTPEDTPVTFPVTANDTDVDGMIDPATLDLDPATPGVQTTFTVPGQGTFTANPVTGQVTFTPVLNFTGTSSIPYVVCDNGTPLPALCDDATITVTVTPVNDPPVANNDVATTPEDTPVTIPVLTNDTDVDGTLDPATVDLDPATPGVQTSFTVPGQGTFTVNPVIGVVTFTPVANFNGPVTPITYVVCDNGTPLPALCDDATITVTVTPANDPPTISQPPVTTPEDTPVTFCPTIGDPDAGDILTLSICNTPANGTAVVGPGNCITFTPAPNFTGVTLVCVQVCDQGGLCATVDVPVTVTPVNDPPIANNDVATTPEDTPVTIPVLTNDTDVDGTLDPATIDLDPATPGVQTSFTVPGQGTFTVNPVTGVVTFTPVANFNGPVTPITYVVCDNGTPLPALCDDATITVTVTPANDPPTISQPPVTTPEDTPVTFCPTIGDPDAGDILTLSICNTPANGTAVVGPGNCITFTPAPNFNGVTLVCVQVCDQGGLCATVDVPVTVTPVNDPPIANNDVATTPEDTPVTFPVTGNDTDVDGMIDPATLDLDPATPGVQTSFTVPGQGTFTANPVTGQVTFTPVQNFSGVVTIPYVVCDNGTPLPAQCDDATITVTVIFDPVAKLQVKVLLQGALLGTNNGLMRDNLRAGGHIPLTEPYTALGVGNPRFTHVGGGGGETTTTTVLAANTGTPNAIVDWVFIELRSAADASVVLFTRSALVQRDGDVVSAADGVSQLTFNGLVGQQFFVSVKHRNHLGAMMASPVTMNNDATIVNFIEATDAQIYDRPGAINYNGFETVVVQDRRALWAGNTNADIKVKYQGTASDNIPILTQSLAFSTNTAGTYNFDAAVGYFSGDVNMDAKVKYQGASNDATFIFVNVVGLYTGLNTAGLYNYDLFIEQLP